MDEETRKILDNHEERIINIEKRFSKAKAIMKKKTKKSLSDHIIDLREKEFFSQPKIAIEVHEKLKESYPCELNRVEVALIRLANGKKLRVASKDISGKKLKAYVW